MLKKKKIDVYYPDSLVVMMEIYGYKYLYAGVHITFASLTSEN